MKGEFFTCKICGSHDLYVEHFYTVWHGLYWVTWVRRGPLGEDHRVEEWDEAEEDESGYEPEMDEDSEEFYVRCERCDREIEFGWSHPDRGGRFWPAECIDFNPWKSWPEPRYRERWAEKGWLRLQE